VEGAVTNISEAVVSPTSRTDTGFTATDLPLLSLTSNSTSCCASVKASIDTVTVD